MPNLNKIWLLALTWWILWTALSYWFLIHEGWTIEIAVIDSLVSNALLAALSTGIMFSVRSSRPDAKRMIYLVSAILISAAFYVWLSGQFLVELIQGDSAYQLFLEESMLIRFIVAFFMITLFAMFGGITYFMRERLDETNRKQEINRLATESELIHLRQQLQPHFLFNTLNSVSILTQSDPEAARKMINQLSEFLRGTLRKEDGRLVSLKEELQYIDLYLQIEKVRFGERLQTIVESDPIVERKQIPPFLLQPLVENAIKFGLYDTLDTVHIEIHVLFESPNLVITISNPYDPETVLAAPGTGFGLTSISRRLFLLFGRNDLLERNSDNGKFTATLKIPQNSNA